MQHIRIGFSWVSLLKIVYTHRNYRQHASYVVSHNKNKNKHAQDLSVTDPAMG